MKKIILLLALLALCYETLAQNHFPTTGSVGIGTINPFSGTANHGLHINKGIHSSILFNDPVSGSGGIIQTSDGKQRIFIGANLYDDQSGSWSSFQTGKGSAGISILADEGNWGTAIDFLTSPSDGHYNSRMRISGNGNIGIGTTNASAGLEVSTSDLTGRTMKIIQQNNSLSNNTYTLEVNSSNHNSNMTTAGAVAIDVYSGRAFTINGFGDIGIGSPNPSEKLDLSKWMTYNLVNDSGIKLGNLNETSVNNNKSHSYTLKTFGDANGIRLGIVQQSRIKNDVEVLSILNDNVGIGTKAPDMKLTVKGKIHAEEVKIDLDVPAPDYVFKEGYTLRSIEEVEKFVREHNHLPEIPSATEFKQNGVMLAEMNMNLLKKIEELTLYTIQQEKKIKKLEEENQELKSLSNRLSKIEKLLLEAQK